MNEHTTPYASGESSRRAHFSGKKTAVITLAVATALTAVALGAISLLNRPEAPATNHNITQPPATIEKSISTTNGNITPPKEQYATLDWSRHNTLKYQKGEISWEANIANGIEQAVTKMDAVILADVDTSDFNIKSAFVDEKDRYVVAWGDIRNYPFGKISFRDVKTGAEKHAYWLNRTDINNLIVLYDVPAKGGFADYAVIVGDTAREELLNEAGRATGVATRRLPLIEILQLTDEGPVPLTYNPAVQERSNGIGIINGKIVNFKVDPLRDKAGNVILNIEMMTDTKPQGSSASVALNYILKLEYGIPILGRFMP